MVESFTEKKNLKEREREREKKKRLVLALLGHKKKKHQSANTIYLTWASIAVD